MSNHLSFSLFFILTFLLANSGLLAQENLFSQEGFTPKERLNIKSPISNKGNNASPNIHLAAKNNQFYGGDIVGSPLIFMCLGDQVLLETTNTIVLPPFEEIAWGVWLLADPNGTTQSTPGPVPPDQDILNDPNFFGTIHGPGTSFMLNAFGDGATYHIAPFVYDAASNTVDPGCSGLSAGYTVYMNDSPSCVSALNMQMNLLLEGNTVNGTMSNQLRMNNLIPQQEPYTALGYDRGTNAGGEVLDFSNPALDEMVDWVLVELRDANNPVNIIGTKAAPLLTNGQITDLDGTTALDLEIPGNGPQEFIVVIRHRNHLSAVFGQTFNALNGQFTLDFSAANGAGQVDLGNGQFALIQGSADGDDVIDAADRSATWNERNGNGYLLEDVNLDGIVDAVDRSITWNNRNKSVVLP